MENPDLPQHTEREEGGEQEDAKTNFLNRYFTDEKDEESGAIEASRDQKNNEEEDKDPLLLRAEENKIYYIFYVICTHSVFSTIIILMILANTIILALDRYPIEDSELLALETANEVLSWCFFAEMIIKVIEATLTGESSLV